MTQAAPALDDLQRRLIDRFQRDVPLVPDMFAAMAAALGSDEGSVIGACAGMMRSGVLSRVGPVVAPRRVGASTLAAIAVPPARLEEIGTLVAAIQAVNHCYEREHAINLWFVATAPSAAALDAVLAGIEARTGLAVLRMKLLEPFHIDLGFPIQWS